MNVGSVHVLIGKEGVSIGIDYELFVLDYEVDGVVEAVVGGIVKVEFGVSAFFPKI